MYFTTQYSQSEYGNANVKDTQVVTTSSVGRKTSE